MANKPKSTTRSFADRRGVQPGTIIRAYCMHGHYMGLVPTKLVNGALLWNTEEIDLVLSGGSLKTAEES